MCENNSFVRNFRKILDYQFEIRIWIRRISSVPYPRALFVRCPVSDTRPPSSTTASRAIHHIIIVRRQRTSLRPEGGPCTYCSFSFPIERPWFTPRGPTTSHYQHNTYVYARDLQSRINVFVAMKIKNALSKHRRDPEARQCVRAMGCRNGHGQHNIHTQSADHHHPRYTRNGRIRLFPLLLFDLRKAIWIDGKNYDSETYGEKPQKGRKPENFH